MCFTAEETSLRLFVQETIYLIVLEFQHLKIIHPNQRKLPSLHNRLQGDLGIRKTLHFLMKLQAQLKSHIEKDTNSCPQFYQSNRGDDMLYLDILKLKFAVKIPQRFLITFSQSYLKNNRLMISFISQKNLFYKYFVYILGCICS